LATDFLYGGTVPAGSFETITLQGLVPGRQYLASIYSVGWDDASFDLRWVTFSTASGDDRLTVNQDQFGKDFGIRVSYQYEADASGSVTLRIAPVNPANVSFHVYGFSNRELQSRNVAPAITSQPQSTTVSDGVPVSLSVVATGIPTPTYQWRLAGAPITNATSATYSVTASAGVVGNYDVVVSNSLSSVTSLVAHVTVGIPGIVNPSFEADAFTIFPGYVSDNGPITGWDSLGGHGINPSNGSPFADNGAIPNGSQVAFMQMDGVLSQTVTGLTSGSQYYVHYYENSRQGGTVPFLALQLGGQVAILAHAVLQVGGSNPYHEMFSDVFAATGTNLLVEFVKTNPQGGDTTALIDNIAIVEVPPGTAPFVSLQPAAITASVGDTVTFTSQGIGSLPLSYQWLMGTNEIQGETGKTLTLSNIQKPQEADYSVRISNGSGNVTSAGAHLTIFEPIPDLFNTGVDDHRALLGNGAIDPHYTLIASADTNYPGPAAFVVNDEWPVGGGAWFADGPVSKWIAPRAQQDSLADATFGDAVGDYTYRTTIQIVDRDPSTVVILGRWATDNSGTDILVNGVSSKNGPSSSFNTWTQFALSSSNATFKAGSNTIDFVVNNAASFGPSGFRVEIDMSNLRIPPGVAPSILTQPLSQKVAEGDTVTLTASARGTAPLSYQWLKDNHPLPGQTNLTLTLSNVTTSASGAYTLSVSNSVSVATSIPADVCVWLHPMPGIVFGTGTDSTGALLTNTTVDPHYTITVSADPDFPGPDALVVIDGQFPIGPWFNSGPYSKWIAPQADQTSGNAPGDYTYHTQFDLTGVDPNQFKVVGSWGTDNGGVDILLNGVSLGLSNVVQFASLTPFSITSGFSSGTNTLDFKVNNAGDAASPTGFRVDLHGYVTIQPTLSITHSDQGISVAWSSASPCQQLQSAPAVSGPWTPVPNATSPYATAGAGAPLFFRLFEP